MKDYNPQPREIIMAIIEGSPAPAFSLPGSDGKPHTLSDYLGKNVILYFYPKDNTPGCTKESCRFRDLQDDLTGLNAVVLGVSADSVTSHLQFIEDFQLPFVLLADEDKAMMTEYGAWGEKMNYGNAYMGIIRSTVIVDPDGVVLKHWKRVGKAETHPDAVLKLLQTR